MGRHKANQQLDQEGGDALRQRRLGQLIAEYTRAQGTRDELTPGQFMEQHPDFSDGLRAFFGVQAAALAPTDASFRVDSTQDQEADEAATIFPTSGDASKTLDPANPDAPTERLGDEPAHPRAEHPHDTTRRFGDYELIGEVARGGMGVVYRARQISLNRVVALKMILSGQLACDEDVRRFHSEAEAAANLTHPGIVPIYEVGECDEQHYFSMGFVEGPSLADEVKQGPLASRTAAQLAKQVAEAVDYAHRRGVIHRDLKPANVLLDSGGQPQITDFGLAKRVSGGSDLTATGQILGTPSYMPPEQAAGKISEVGPRSDVYSIGAVLYEMLTGRAPFRESNPVDTLIQVLDTQPVAPRIHNPKVPRDLEIICLKCLEKDPSFRYGSAQELAEDLDRYLQGELIHASSVNLLGRASRALTHSRFDEHFQGWGMAVITLGIIIFVAHLATHLLSLYSENVLVAYWIPRVAMFVAIFALLWKVRPQTILPTGSTERPIWAIWIGYLVSIGVLNLVLDNRGVEHFELFWFSAILSGFGFFVMGSHVWGGCYVIGCAFWAAAPLLAKEYSYASLLFGTLWGVGLTICGWRYWRQGKRSEEEKDLP